MVFPLRQGRPAPAPRRRSSSLSGLRPPSPAWAGPAEAPSARPAFGFGHFRIPRATGSTALRRRPFRLPSFRPEPVRSLRLQRSTASTASASTALPESAVSSAAWVAAVGADGARSRFRPRPPSRSSSAARAGDHQHQRRSRSGRRRRRVRRLRDPHADLRQRRQICRRAAKLAVLTKRGRARPLRAGLLLR